MSDKILTDLYYNTKSGYLSADKFYERLKSMGVEVTKSKVKNFVESQEITQLSKKPEQQKQSYQINSTQLSFMIDKIYLPKSLSLLKNSEVKNIIGYDKLNCFLLLVDILSRKAYIYMLPNRNMNSTLDKYKEFITDLNKDAHKYDGTINEYPADNDGKIYPNELRSDDEFGAKIFIDYNNEHNISVKHSTASDDHITKSGDRLATIDRLTRTIKSILMRIVFATNDLRGMDIRETMNGIVESYNDTSNNGISNYTPNEVFGDKELRIKLFNEAIEHNDEVTEMIKDKFKEGDTVRIYESKGEYKKEVPQFSRDIYYIVGRYGAKWKVKNEEGNTLKRSFKTSELQAVQKNKIQHQNPQNINEILNKNTRVNKLKLEMKRDDVNPELIIGTQSEVKKPKAITRTTKMNREAKELMTRWGFDKMNKDKFNEEGKVAKKKR
jgi:hypothetical protein